MNYVVIVCMQLVTFLHACTFDVVLKVTIKIFAAIAGYMHSLLIPLV